MPKVQAAVLVAAEKLEIQEFDLPTVSDDNAIVEIEACGLCGSDIEQFDGRFESFGVSYPTIPGHEPIGRIAEIGRSAAQHWGVAVGDRVAVEPLIGCGRCVGCLTGHRNRCSSPPAGTRVNSYGYVPATTAPGLWGGYAQYLHLDPMSVVHRVDPALPLELAVLYQPVGCGIRWFAHDSGLRLGDAIVILGCGQRGLTGVVAAREAGAGQIIVTGLRADEHKLTLAKKFGADATIVADEQDVVAAVLELTGGQGADVVVDVAAVSMQPIVDAVDIARRGGTIVISALKGSGRTVPGLVPDKLVLKELTIKGLAAQDMRAYIPALRLLESRKYPLELMHTHTFALSEAELAVRTLAGRVPGERAISVMLDPR
jgi:threonine dehydrogenase-like Zn-dependent dehydrogenase